MQVLMPSIASLCFSGVFFQDYHDGFFIYEQIRGNVNTYLLSKAVACWISAFLAVVLGMCIFIFCIALKFPLLSDASYVNMNAYQTDSFGELLAHHHYIAFIAIRILTRGISAGRLGGCCPGGFPFLPGAVHSAFRAPFCSRIFPPGYSQGRVFD